MTKRKGRLLRDKRAVSPVIATVVLVAVTIVVAVAVAYWMGGIAGLYTRFEELKIQSYNAQKLTFNVTANPDVPPAWDGKTGWNVTLTVKNAGTADATIDNVLINGETYSSYAQINMTADLATDGISVPSGKTAIVIIYVLADYPGQAEGFTSGTNIEVKLHTAAARDYPQLLTLP